MSGFVAERSIATGARFLITCWPFDGHLFPQMSVAGALHNRGHHVAFHTGESARAAVESAGFEFFGFDAIDESAAYGDVRRLETAVRNRRAPVRLVAGTLRDWLVETVPAQVTDLRAVAARWQPDVVIADIAMWGAITVSWEADELPVAISSNLMGPLIPGPDAPPWGMGLAPPRSALQHARARAIGAMAERLGTGLRMRLDAIRGEYGLGPLGCTVNAFTARVPLYLVPSVPELDYSRRDLPDSVHYVGPCLWHPPERAMPPATSLATIPTDRPWVHVTEGTLAGGRPFLLHAAASGLAGRSMEAILTTCAQRGTGELDPGTAASNIHMTDWLSHRDLLPRCAAVVTTGGTGTIMASLQAGVPLVVVPTAWDKPDNARRVTEAGVGVRLAARRCTPERLCATVEKVLADPSYRVNAQRIANRLVAKPGPAGAAELLGNLVARPANARAERARL